MTETPNTTKTLPVLPLRDIVVFPHMVVPLFVGREKSVKALEDVMRETAFDSVERELGATLGGELPPAFCLFDEDWHQGVIGIVAPWNFPVGLTMGPLAQAFVIISAVVPAKP